MMLEDLIFKGKTLEEALAKAGNFFGAEPEELKYKSVDGAPDGEVWIRLTEQPTTALTKARDEKPESLHRYPKKDQRKRRPAPGYAEQVRTNMQEMTGIETQSTSRQTTQQRRDRHHHYQPQTTSARGGARDQRKAGRERAQQHSGGRRPARPDSKPSPGADRNRPRQREHLNNTRQSSDNRNQRWSRSQQDLTSLSELEREAHKFVLELFDKIGFRIDVKVVHDQSRMVFNLDGPDRNLVLGNKGALLTSIQYLVNKIYMSKKDMPQKIFVDSLGYRVAREEELREIARISAQRVRESGQEYLLNPMNPYERRLVHLALKEDQSVTTISQGDGFIKRVAIIPRDGEQSQLDDDEAALMDIDDQEEL